jgi:hypothetical protein
VSFSDACDPDTSAAVFVQVTQSTGNRLAQAPGFFDRTTCDGSSHTATTSASVLAFPFSGAVPFKAGKAAATVTLSQFDPLTEEFLAVAAGPRQVRLKK